MFVFLGSGIVAGGALSLILFKRRFWPVTLGIGIGAGMAMASCQNKINSTDVVRVKAIRNILTISLTHSKNYWLFNNPHLILRREIWAEANSKLEGRCLDHHYQHHRVFK